MIADRLAIRPMNVQPIPRLSLREPEAAEALGVSPSWLRREALAGHVPSALMAGVRLYSIDELRRWLSEQTQQQHAEAGERGQQ